MLNISTFNKCIEFTYKMFLFSVSGLKYSLKFWSQEPVSQKHLTVLTWTHFSVNIKVFPLLVLPLDSLHSSCYLCNTLWFIYPVTLPWKLFLGHSLSWTKDPAICHLLSHLFIHFYRSIEWIWRSLMHRYTMTGVII